MNCPNCNNAVPNGAERCPSCGFLLNAAPTPEVVPNPADTAAPAPTPMPNVAPEAPAPTPIANEMPDLTLPSDVPETTAASEPIVPETPSPSSTPIEPAPITIPEAPAPIAPEVPAEPVIPEAPAIEPAVSIEPAPIAPANEDGFKATAAAPAEETANMNPTPIVPETQGLTPNPMTPGVPPIEPATPVQIEPATAANPETPAPAPKEKKKAPVTLVLAILLLLLIVSAGIILYTRGFFDSILGKQTPVPSQTENNGTDNDKTDDSDDSSDKTDDNTDNKDESSKTPSESTTSFTIGGYEFNIPEGYEAKTVDNQVRLVNKDGSVDIVVSNVYKGTKADLQEIVPEAKEVIEKAGNTYNSSRSGTRNSKFFLSIGYTKDNVKYETIMMIIEDGYILSLTSLKTDGIATDDLINLSSTIIDNKTSDSKPNSSLQSINDAFTVQTY